MKSIVLSLVLICATSLAETTKKNVTATGGDFRQIALSAMLWHEEVEATKDSVKAKLAMQFQGLQARYAHHYGLKWPGWRYAYMTDFAVGVVKGKGSESSSIPDEFKNQPWTKINFTPGLFYTTTPVSEIGFGLPMGARLINWALESDSELKMAKAASLSLGASIIYLNKLSDTTDFNVTFDYQFLWSTTIVSIGWGKQF